jgi:hypothetical protein
MLLYGGYSPYECLYGCNPSPIFSEESEFLAQLGSDSTMFYEHAQVRAKAIAHFQQALIHTGLARVNTSRPRADQQKAYKIGEWVDVWRKPKNKDMAGWRGPCLVLTMLGEGFLTVRWQGLCFDIPAHHCRPHITATPTATLPSTGPPITAVLKPAIVDKPAIEEVDAQPQIEEGAFIYIAEQCSWNAIEDDTCFKIQSDVFPTLQSIAMCMKSGHQQIHAVTLDNTKVVQSDPMTRDGGAIFSLGKQLAAERGIQNYQGIIINVGRLALPLMKGVKNNHVISWTGDTSSPLVESCHARNVDWRQHGIESTKLRHHHVIAILESHPTGGETFTDMLQKSKLTEETEDFGPGRVRFKTTEEIAPVVELDNMSESSRRLSDFDTPSRSEELAMFLKSDQTLKESLGHRFRHAFQEHCNDFEDDVDSDSDDVEYMHETWIIDSEDCLSAYPVDRATRAVTSEELRTRSSEIREARKKELQSWIDNKTGKAELRLVWEKRTGRKAIPSRWVDTWKLKSGELIAKSRLCLKGFAEPITPDESNASPTASRISHRIVCHVSAQRKWVLASLDVSVAFLKGLTFSELSMKGTERKPVAFKPCEQVWELMNELAPAEYAHVMRNKDEYIFVLEKAAYGLRDAPLLWHLRAVEVLKEIGYRPLLHDGCTFVLREGSTNDISSILTLHVDD